MLADALNKASATDMAPWWRGAAIYQIYPRSFADSNGDGVGDLPGITQRLDHVAKLGVDAVWLSPFFTSPMRDFGYDVADYCGVDPVFGTLADFDQLVGGLPSALGSAQTYQSALGLSRDDRLSLNQRCWSELCE